MKRLTIYLKDGRSFSGVYHFLAALARLEYASKLPDFKNAEWGPDER